jgi:hypothetical protein
LLFGDRFFFTSAPFRLADSTSAPHYFRGARQNIEAFANLKQYDLSIRPWWPMSERWGQDVSTYLHASIAAQNGSKFCDS